MKFLRLLKNDLQRAVCSYRFLACILAVIVLTSTGAYTSLMSFGDSTMNLLWWSLAGTGIKMLLLCILPLVPFAMSFAFEWKEKSYLFYVSKVGPEQYVLSKMIVSAISGFLVLFIGVFLSVPIIRMFAPDIPWTNLESGVDFYSSFFEKGQVFAGYFIYILDYALIGCLTSACGVWFSTCIPSPFAVLAAPMLIYFILLRIGEIYLIPGIYDKFILFNPSFWVDNSYPTTSWVQEIGYRIASILMLSAIMSFFAVRKTKRRVLNG